MEDARSELRRSEAGKEKGRYRCRLLSSALTPQTDPINRSTCLDNVS